MSTDTTSTPTSSQTGSRKVIDGSEVPSVAIDWYRSVPWWRLCSKTIAISWRSSHLLLGTIGVLLTILGGNISERIFGSVEFDSLPLNAFWGFGYPSKFSVITLAGLCFTVLWTWCVWSFVGGVLVRRSVVELGTMSSAGWIESVQLVASRWVGLLWSLAMPWLAFGVLLAPFAIFGLISQLGTVGNGIAFVGVMAYSLAILSMTWMVIAGLLGAPLSIAAVVTEKNGDGFEGFSRSCAYVYQKPATVIVGIAAMSVFGVAVCYIFSIGLGIASYLSSQVFMIASGEPHLLHRILVPVLTSGLIASFVCTSSAALYLTLRNEIDHADFDDIDFEQEKKEKESDLRGGNSPENPAISGEMEQAE